MLLAEELALVALNPGSGHHTVGARSQLNACLAGLLVAELLLDGLAEPGEPEGVVVATGRAASSSSTLDAAADVVADKGPKIKPILSHMDRSLSRRFGAGTWDAVMAGLVRAGVVTEQGGRRRRRYQLADVAARDSIVERLRAAAATDDALDGRTALLLSMTGPARLLEVVAPARQDRRHTRGRIDHALDNTDFEPVGTVVRRLIAEAAAAALATTAVVTTSSG